MKPPTIIRLMGRNYEVEMVDDPFDSNKVGTFESQQMRINLKTGQKPVEEVDTLLHEVLHALCYLLYLDLGHREEEVVCKLATGLVAAFQDNPTLGKYLTETHK